MTQSGCAIFDQSVPYPPRTFDQAQVNPLAAYGAGFQYGNLNINSSALAAQTLINKAMERLEKNRL